MNIIEIEALEEQRRNIEFFLYNPDLGNIQEALLALQKAVVPLLEAHIQEQLRLHHHMTGRGRTSAPEMQSYHGAHTHYLGDKAHLKMFYLTSAPMAVDHTHIIHPIQQFEGEK